MVLVFLAATVMIMLPSNTHQSPLFTPLVLSPAAALRATYRMDSQLLARKAKQLAVIREIVFEKEQLYKIDNLFASVVKTEKIIKAMEENASAMTTGITEDSTNDLVVTKCDFCYKYLQQQPVLNNVVNDIDLHDNSPETRQNNEKYLLKESNILLKEFKGFLSHYNQCRDNLQKCSNKFFTASRHHWVE